jgi:hypothetical protein
VIGDWIIVFMFSGQRRRLQTPMESQYDFEEINKGFWIDEQHQLVRENRGKYWIPPSQIEVIERLQ